MAAFVGAKVASQVLGHSEAEQAFRPWWDKFEDQLIYGLITLGLIVFPTAMISSTPLWCTICTKGLCEDESKISQEKGPGHNAWWLKQYCTLDPKTVDQFLLYFPYVLLIVALTLFVIERAFNSFFKATKELEAFHSLLVKTSILESKSEKDENDDEEKEKDGKDKAENDEAIDHDKLAYSVSKGFGTSSNYFRSYLIRTIAELIISTGLFVWLIIRGYEPLFGENNRSQGNSIFGTKAVLCEIGDFWYHCTGIPFQFYLIIFLAALVLLLLYILSCSFVLVWLLAPSCGSLSNIMEKFESNFENLKEELDQNEFQVGGLYSVYYHNKDTKLLLDLLAASSGIGPCLKLLCFFDKSLQQKAQVENVKVSLQDPDSNGKRDAVVEFKDSKAVMEIFSQIPKASCTYAVEINPPVKSGSWRVLNYALNTDKPDGARENGTENLLESGKAENYLIPMTSLDTIRFRKLAPDVNYQITISTQINGTIVAISTSKSVKF